MDAGDIFFQEVYPFAGHSSYFFQNQFSSTNQNLCPNPSALLMKSPSVQGCIIIMLSGVSIDLLFFYFTATEDFPSFQYEF